MVQRQIGIRLHKPVSAAYNMSVAVLFLFSHVRPSHFATHVYRTIVLPVSDAQTIISSRDLLDSITVFDFML